MTATQDKLSAENPCWPTCRAFVGEFIGDPCPDCGHSNVLHSQPRGCIGCELIIGAARDR